MYGYPEVSEEGDMLIYPVSSLGIYLVIEIIIIIKKMH